MAFDQTRGLNLGGCQVWFEKPEIVVSAMAALQGAVLFGHQIRASKDRFHPDFKLGNHKEFSWGWVASNNPDAEKVQLRPPLLSPPSDIFAPLRERRRVIFGSLPDLRKTRKHPSYTLHEQLYSLLHGYNVMGCSMMYFSPRKDTKKNGVSIGVDFATHEEAKSALNSFNGCKILGRPLRTSFWHPSTENLNGASWDEASGSVHFNSESDRGSAKGTNFEAVSSSL